MVTIRNDFKVELLDQYGTDTDIVRAAWVSSGNTDLDADEKRINGVLRALMREKHGTPFESGYFAFRIEAPRAVRDEMVRHRMISFSSASLRYTEGSREYYIPGSWRPIAKDEGFKQIQPKYKPLTSIEHSRYVRRLKEAYEQIDSTLDALSYDGREETEARRWVTPDGMYTSWIARMNPRALMHFLGLRTHEPEAAFVSWPMYEIEEVARQMEEHFKMKLPLTYNHWNTFGRVAP